jgi:anaerobic ribonucleoside-triphosphate reductase activating protein
VVGSRQVHGCTGALAIAPAATYDQGWCSRVGSGIVADLDHLQPASAPALPLRVAQIVEQTEAEGPGLRFAVWVQGCPMRCPGCCNLEMLPLDRGGELLEVEALLEQINRVEGLEGLTLLGGEPFAQAASCALLAAAVQGSGLTTMVFSGYTLDQLQLAAADDPAQARLLAATDLLVDGPYEQDHPESRRRWIGSANQQLHLLSERYTAADPRFSEPNSVEIRLDPRTGQLTVNGWPAGARALQRRPGETRP